MDNLVSIINKLQDVFSTIGKDPIELPQIIAVGSQSSGKSSVLESVVGRSFLPRGVGVMTRRPLIVQMTQCLRNDPRRTDSLIDDWGIFLHDPKKIYKNFVDIRKEIEEETERKAGTNKGICTEPIVLKLFSDKILTLTLVDLPGLTRVPVGDQPVDVEAKIRDLILDYIKNPNSIILPVVTANTDMETSESLQLAREVDPLGLRTLAVVTKLDLMDAGTNALNILEGRVVPVKLGIIGVVNRSQKDINNGVTIKQAIENEANFLHRNYPTIASKHGTPFLAKTLQIILMKHIKHYLPDLRYKVSVCLSKFQAELGTLGKNITNHKNDLLEMLTLFAKAYSSTIEGTCIEFGTNELEGGARISYIFHETFTRTLNHLDPLQGFDRSGILTAMRNASGTKPALFIPEGCFELLVKKQIAKLAEPALCCVQLVRDELERTVDNCGSNIQLELIRFPKLRVKIVEVLSTLIKSRVTITMDIVEKLVMIHTSYINTAHPDFVEATMRIQAACSDPKLLDPKQQNMAVVGTVRDIRNIQGDSVSALTRVPRDLIFIEHLITSYFNIVRKVIADTVPKAIMYFMVNYVLGHLLPELVSKIYSQEEAECLLQESPSVAVQRIRTEKMIDALHKADTILSEVRDTKIL